MTQDITTPPKRSRSSIRRSTNTDLTATHAWLVDEKKLGVHGNFLCNWSVIERAHQNGDLLVYIDGQSGQPAAFQLGKLIYPGILQVRKAYRRKGIGRKMVERCFSINRKRDECCLYIQCKPSSSIPFWESMGFTLINTRDGHNYAYRILEKNLSLPEKGMDIKVVIRFFPESCMWETNKMPFAIHEPKARLGQDNIIYLDKRVSFNTKTQTDAFDRDVVIGIEVDEKQRYLDKAKYQEAQAIGVRRCTNGFYIDKIRL
ncbi:MAG: GNAT family N-acetyltransferase [Chlorobiaceae bacterium]|nr:GNAT family N-acetyltransferase [Chlorobiaceae bacterium]